MKLGNKFNFFLILFLISYNFSLFAEDKITSTPLINLNEIKPSFEELNEENDNLITYEKLKKKVKPNNNLSTSHAILIGLDKITAKSSELKINLNEVKASSLFDKQ